MKKKIRTVLLYTWKASGKSLLGYAVTVMLCTFIVSVSLFFTDSDAIEQSMAATLPLSLQIRDNSYFGYMDTYSTCMENRYDFVMNNPEDNRTASRKFLEDIDTLGSDPDVSAYNRIMEVHSVNMDITGDNGISISGCMSMASVRDMSMLERKGLEIDGPQELSDHGVLMHMLAVQSGFRKGDRIIVKDARDTTKVITELTVEGFYTTGNSSNRNLTMSNLSETKSILTTDETILSILEQCPDYYGLIIPADPPETGGIYWQDYESDEEYNEAVSRWYAEHKSILIDGLTVYGIEYEMDTLAAYNSFNTKLNTFVNEENNAFAKMFTQMGNPTKLGLMTMTNDFGSMMTSIGRIRMIYRFIMAGIWLLAVMTMYGFISFLQKNRKREIFIRRSLGCPKHKIVMFYLKYYLIPSVPLILLGCIPGYGVAVMMSSAVTKGAVQAQSDIAQLIGGNVYRNSGVSLFDTSLSRLILVLVMIMAVMLVCIGCCISLSTRNVMRENLKDTVRGL
ncbi:MAG: FtsX-like permease family protein [Bulleidia sp.]